MKNIPYALAWLVLYLSFPLVGQNVGIQNAIEDFVAKPALKHASVGIYLINLDNQQPIGWFDEDRSLIPASTLKLLTTTTSIALLGPDHTMSTQVFIDGNFQEAGVLSGNVIILGQGDPVLGSPDMPEAISLNQWCEDILTTLRDKGVQKIEGSIWSDPTYFDGPVNSPTWPWNDLGNYYASGTWGINIHENAYNLTFKQTPILGGQPAIHKVAPYIPGMTLINELTSAGWNTGDNAYIFGGPYQMERYIRGTIPIGNGLFKIKGSIPNPPLFLAQYLTHFLTENGISISGKPLVKTNLEEPFRYESFDLLHANQSPPINAIIERANQKSVNLYCESLIKLLGKEAGSSGSIEQGIEAIENYWDGRGLDFSGCHLEDGSGLSPRNLLTPKFLAQLMGTVYQDERLWPFIKPSLPVAGQSGTLKSFLKGTPAQGRIRAKSGTMYRIRSYAGILEGPRGQPYAFAIITNHFEGKSSSVKRAMEELLLRWYKQLAQ